MPENTNKLSSLVEVVDGRGSYFAHVPYPLEEEISYDSITKLPEVDHPLVADATYEKDGDVYRLQQPEEVTY